MRKAIHALLTSAARVYLRKIEIRGVSHVPKVPAIYAGNHPSGLIDPIVVMSALPEKVREGGGRGVGFITGVMMRLRQ